MTAKSFSEYIDETEPQTISASHYDLAPDVYGLDDGYAWAFATTGDDGHGNATRNPREHLSEGGEWPYLIAAKPTPDPRSADRYTLSTAEADRTPEMLAALTEHRVLETYCEGDLVAYIFETRDERDTAAERWEETRAEEAARIIAEDYEHECNGNANTPAAEALAAALIDLIDDGYGADGNPDDLRESIASVMEDRYAGEWGSLADYVEDFYESTTPSREAANARAAERYEPAPEGIFPGDELWNAIDWERIASDWEQDHSTADAPGGNVYVFRGA